ncbi:hypothetical protein BOW53_12755 [Solemya pervernicosa gill symbiont]|uniref:Type II secretion system protein M n=2 Tax=Gammaproteobacteria incertae sedis TaxID=118884 RepID=A0A1T2L237_9GAMM|nr:type II secretion system protein M [Candidatus Reidiella endopervernicosa]OOZ39165.1 hypothetical protein BOW53_12755 [Solemya pervernicosa gill symbiont]QKQ28006.1 type II secretion system protein M [Candidatus Reidiella endopervernicosa]
MSQWWSGLEARERRMLMFGAVALLALALYALVWEPYQKSNTRLQQRVEQQRDTLNWMEQARLEAASLRGRTTTPQGSNESLLSLTDRTAKLRKLGSQIKRLQPDSDTSVRVWLEQSRFDILMHWLGELQSRYGITIATLQIDRQESAGIVNARLTLQRRAP